MKIKINRKIFIIVIVVFSILIAAIYYLLRPIADSELTKTGDCYKPSSSLESRCSLLGGEIRSKLVALGVGPVYEIGCFPKGEARDSGEKCLTDSECGKNPWYKKEYSDIMKVYCKKYYKSCEGICIGQEWGGLVIKENLVDIHYSCSKFKKPYFVKKETYIFGVENDGLVWDKKSM